MGKWKGVEGRGEEGQANNDRRFELDDTRLKRSVYAHKVGRIESSER